MMASTPSTAAIASDCSTARDDASLRALSDHNPIIAALDVSGAALALALALIAVLALPGLALASTHEPEIPGESNLGFLMTGLIIIWAGFFAYVFYLSGKTREMHREIEQLRTQLTDKSVTPP